MTAPLVLRLAPGDDFGGSDFVVRVTEEYAASLTHALQDAGLDAEMPLSHAASGRQGAEILVTVVNAVGGIEGIARVLAIFLARHEKKSIVLPDGLRIDGYGTSDVVKILRKLQERSHSSAPSSTPTTDE